MKHFLAKSYFAQIISDINGTISAPELVAMIPEAHFSDRLSEKGRAYIVSTWLQAAAKAGKLSKAKGCRRIAPTGGMAWNIYHRPYKSALVVERVKANHFIPAVVAK